MTPFRTAPACPTALLPLVRAWRKMAPAENALRHPGAVVIGRIRPCDPENSCACVSAERLPSINHLVLFAPNAKGNTGCRWHAWADQHIDRNQLKVSQDMNCPTR